MCNAIVDICIYLLFAKRAYRITEHRCCKGAQCTALWCNRSRGTGPARPSSHSWLGAERPGLWACRAFLFTIWNSFEDTFKSLPRLHFSSWRWSFSLSQNFRYVLIFSEFSVHRLCCGVETMLFSEQIAGSTITVWDTILILNGPLIKQKYLLSS